MSRTRVEILGEALDHFRVMLDHAEEGPTQLVVDAVCMRLSAGIEALSRLPEAQRQELFGSDWALMWGMRNRIAHGYLLVEPSIVRQTLDRDVPVIVDRIRAAIEV